MKTLMKGNEAIVKGAIAAGCRGFFGYPITPQNEVPEFMSELMPKAGGVFVQAESELASINMVYGGAAAGARVMTSSSSPGVSLMQEGISYIAASELPAVIVNVQRGGPGLGNIAPGQADYFQATRGGGHGEIGARTRLRGARDLPAHEQDLGPVEAGDGGRPDERNEVGGGGTLARRARHQAALDQGGHRTSLFPSTGGRETSRAMMKARTRPTTRTLTTTSSGRSGSSVDPAPRSARKYDPVDGRGVLDRGSLLQSERPPPRA